jgi:hypothetical protein
MDEREQDVIYETNLDERVVNGSIVRSFKVSQDINGG